MDGGLYLEKELYGLQCCYRDLVEMRQRAMQNLDDKAVRYAVIKTFELTWEMAIKTMTSYLERTTVTPSKVEDAPYQDVIRLGERAGILKLGWPEWKKFRELRGRTVHSYGEVSALAAETELDVFIAEVGSMLGRIERSVQDGD